MDDDNAIARHKPLLDWLKKRRYIVDDRRSRLRWESLPDQVVKRDGNYRIVLILTPVDAFGAPDPAPAVQTFTELARRAMRDT